jgi:membrane fusion protein, multidrug efflux system
METNDNPGANPVPEARPAPSVEKPSEPKKDQAAAAPVPDAAKGKSHPLRKWLVLAVVVAGLAFGIYRSIPLVETMLNTVSTDDAYVNGHATFVAPRVAGQVSRVLVDDNFRVRKGDLLVELDKEPFQIQVAIRQSAVIMAQADLEAAKAQVRGLEALARSQRWLLQSAMEQVANQVSNLRANVAAYENKKSSLELARANRKRGEELAPRGGISKEDLDQRRQAEKGAEAAVEQALQAVYANRVALGLPEQPPKGRDLTDVPPDLDQTFSGVRTALANAVQTMAQIGLPLIGTETTPKLALEDFIKRDASGDIDRIMEKLVPNAPAVKQADAKLLQARRDLDLADLNLRYCNVVSEIDGVVTRRNVNPGNNVQVGQSLMAVRSVTEIWIDANFKETELADLRIGQRVRLKVDMYGKRRDFEGRITGLTMGTGQTLSLLPAQNATGNFIKVVQRLPVRVELTNYDPDKEPLFVGLSVIPYVYIKEPPSGPDAGKVLQPNPAAAPASNTSSTSKGASS